MDFHRKFPLLLEFGWMSTYPVKFQSDLALFLAILISLKALDDPGKVKKEQVCMLQIPIADISLSHTKYKLL